MVTWFWNLVQGDFANNPTGWIDLLITVAGILAAPITHFIDSKKSKEDADKAQENFDSELVTLKAQLKAAQDSADALREQVGQLKEANRIAEEANPFAVVPWDDAEWTGNGSQFLIRNKSSRTVVVTRLSASDERLDGLMDFEEEPPFVCNPNDVITYFAANTWQTGTPSTLIEWHWEGSDESKTTKRPNIKL